MDLARLLPWFIGWAMVFGPLTGWYARRRARQPFVWLIYGAVLGPLAGLLLGAAPPGRCPACDERVVGWARACPSCGSLHHPPLEGWVASGTELGQRAHRWLTASTGADDQARALATPWADPPTAADGGDGWPTALVASGTFVSGAGGLVAGARYGLARHGDFLLVVGPLDGAPGHVAFQRRVRDLDLTAVGDALVVTGRGADEGILLLSFRSVVSLEDGDQAVSEAASLGRPGEAHGAPALGPSVRR